MRALLVIVAALALPATSSAQSVGSVTFSESAGVARVPVTPSAPRSEPRVAVVAAVDDDPVTVKHGGTVVVGPAGTLVDVRKGEAEYRGATLSGAVFRVKSSSLLELAGRCGRTLRVRSGPGLRVRGRGLTTSAVSESATWSIADGCARTVVRVLAGRVRVGSRVLRAGRHVSMRR